MSKGRLPSFRAPRDLSLGGSGSKSSPKAGMAKALWSDPDKKKKFAPNLNVQRKETKSASQESSSSGAKPTSASGWKKPHSKDDKASRQSKPDLIQTTGMFADGVGSNAGSSRRSGWGSGGGGSSSDRESGGLERPKLDLNTKFDKAEEEKKLKQLLRDDFIDDLKTGHLVPIQLPMVNTGKVFSENKDSKETVDDVIKPKVRKNRILDSDDDEDDETLTEPKPKILDDVKKSEAAGERDLTMQDLIGNEQSELLFFQMPDHLPAKSATDKTNPEDNITLHDLPEGYLGKLQFRKSGKVQLWINDVLFDVDVGTQVGFLQELYSIQCGSIKQEENNGSHASFYKGSMTNLGRVRNRVVTMPAWTDLLQATSAAADDEDSSSDEESD